MIISELQGNENDPDQLLDTEVTAAAFKAHSYRHPTIGWLERSGDDVSGRSVRLLHVSTIFRTTRRSSWSVTSRPMTRFDGAEQAFGGHRSRGTLPERVRTVEP